VVDMREIGKFVVLKMLRGYKWAISPMFPPACRYVPTCSEYAMESVERYGVLRGVGMALRRLMRCHPLARGGFDPVVKRSADRRMGEFGREDESSCPQISQGLKPAFASEDLRGPFDKLRAGPTGPPLAPYDLRTL
jgi:hypothetical protein